MRIVGEVRACAILRMNRGVRARAIESPIGRLVELEHCVADSVTQKYACRSEKEGDHIRELVVGVPLCALKGPAIGRVDPVVVVWRVGRLGGGDD